MYKTKYYLRHKLNYFYIIFVMDFVVQTIASLFALIGITTKLLNIIDINYIYTIASILTMEIRAAPPHLLFPVIIEGKI